MQLFKIKVGKEITVYEDLLNQPDMTVYIQYPVDSKPSAIVCLEKLSNKAFYKAIGEGYHFYERIKEAYSEDVVKFIEAFNEFKADANLTETDDLTNDDLEKLYNDGWRLTKRKKTSKTQK